MSPDNSPSLQEIESIRGNRENIDRLIQQLDTPLGVIPFIGAGLSIPFGFPGWGSFLLCRANSSALRKRIKGCIRGGDYEEAAEILWEELQNRGFQDAIDSIFGDHQLQGKQLKGAISYLPRLCSGPAITTNFDHLLEKIFQAAGCPFEYVVWGAKVDMITKALHQNRPFLLKIHGDVEDRTDRILTRNDYQRHYGDPGGRSVDFSLPLPRLLQQMMMSRPLLFIGCSLSQDRTVAVLKRVAMDFPAVAHYAILEKAASIARHVEQQRYLSEHNIRPIWFPTGRFDLIESLLAYLAKHVRQRQPRGASTSSGFSLPTSQTSFIGRESLLIEAGRLLPRTGLLTLTGSPGCGKTRLALKIAENSKAQYADGVWFVDLTLLSHPSSVPQTVASVLGLKEEPARPINETLFEYLSSKSLLLLIDNCEHVLTACAALISELLRACINVRVIATSQEPLHISGEVEFDVPPLTYPSTEELPTLDSLAGYEAIQLFVERASFISQKFRLSEANALVLAQICERLDGIPLAIELAAAQVKALAPAQIVKEMDNRFLVLQANDPTALPRKKRLKSAIDWSYGLLSKSEKVLFRRLSLFRGGFTLDALKEVCTGNGIREGNVVRLLSQLVNKSLVIAEEQQGLMRYRLLETLRLYGWDKLNQSEEAATLRQKHSHFFLKAAEKAATKLQKEDQAVWLNYLEKEHENLRTALTWGEMESSDEQVGLRLAGALWEFWWIRGYLSDGRAWLSRALTRSGAGKPTKARALALTGAGHLAYDQSDYVSSRTFYQEALDVARSLGDRQAIAESLNNLGSIYEAEGDFPTARKVYIESLTLFREGGESRQVAQLLCNLGNVSEAEGDYTSARELYQEGLNICRELEDSAGVADALYNMGKIAEAEDDDHSARTLYSQSLDLFRALGDTGGITLALNGLGNVAYYRDQYTSAREHYKESLAIEQTLGSKKAIAESLINLANVAEAEGDLASARELHEKSLALFKELKDKRGIAEAFNSLGDVTCNLGDYTAARRFYEEGMAGFRELGDERRVASLLSSLADVFCEQQDYVHARTLYEDSLNAFRETRDHLGVADTLSSLGDLLYSLEDYDSARALYDECLTIQRRLNNIEEVAETLNNLGNVAYEQGDLVGAQMSYEEGLALFTETGDQVGRANLLNNLGNIFYDKGDGKAARIFFEEGLAIEQDLGIQRLIADSLNSLGNVARSEGNLKLALSLHSESLSIFRELDDEAGLAMLLESFAYLASEQNQHEKAARLAGAAETIRQVIKAPLSPHERLHYDVYLNAVRLALGEHAFTKALTEGRSMPLKSAVAYTIDNNIEDN